MGTCKDGNEYGRAEQVRTGRGARGPSVGSAATAIRPAVDKAEARGSAADDFVAAAAMPPIWRACVGRGPHRRGPVTGRANKAPERTGG